MTFKTLTRHFPRSLAVHVFSVAVGLTPFAPAQAQIPAPTQGQYNCQLSGQMAGASVAVGLGGQDLFDKANPDKNRIVEVWAVQP